MQTSSSPDTIQVEFFTYGYRISGVFDAQRRLLADVVYDPTTSYLIVNDAYLSPIGQPMTISASYTKAQIAKDKVSLILTMNLRDGLRSDRQYYRGSYKAEVVITLPFFEVTGQLFTSSPFKLESFLSIQAGAFINLSEATARSTFDPDVTYHGGAAIINTSHISCIGLKRNHYRGAK
ncbi:MAG: hypothetical protein JW981_06305 [Anaerolineae bacterium]|nr:hypothetical protein [Anaerolineae bacterium]